MYEVIPPEHQIMEQASYHFDRLGIEAVVARDAYLQPPPLCPPLQHPFRPPCVVHKAVEGTAEIPSVRMMRLHPSHAPAPVDLLMGLLQTNPVGKTKDAQFSCTQWMILYCGIVPLTLTPITSSFFFLGTSPTLDGVRIGALPFSISPSLP